MGGRMACKRTLRRASLRVPLVLLITTAGVAVSGAPSGVASVDAIRSAPTAHAAKTVTVRLSAQLRLVGRPGRVDYEKGTFSGTFPGTVAAHIEAAGTSGGTGTFTMYPKGGSISGRAVTHGRVNGAIVTFAGTATVTSGTGTWAHASGTGLHYEGELDRQNFRATSVLSGNLHQ
jgi:hypothetical protein